MNNNLKQKLFQQTQYGKDTKLIELETTTLKITRKILVVETYAVVAFQSVLLFLVITLLDLYLQFKSCHK